MSFGSVSENFSRSKLDLNQRLITHPAGTYFLRMEGNSMKTYGIFDNDILIVDRALEAANHKIIIGELNTELIIREFIVQDNLTYLKSSKEQIQITDKDNFSLWGVVTYTIRSFINR